MCVCVSFGLRNAPSWTRKGNSTAPSSPPASPAPEAGRGDGGSSPSGLSRTSAESCIETSTNGRGQYQALFPKSAASLAAVSVGHRPSLRKFHAPQSSALLPQQTPTCHLNGFQAALPIDATWLVPPVIKVNSFKLYNAINMITFPARIRQESGSK